MAAGGSVSWSSGGFEGYHLRARDLSTCMVLYLSLRCDSTGGRFYPGFRPVALSWNQQFLRVVYLFFRDCRTLGRFYVAFCLVIHSDTWYLTNFKLVKYCI